jgi:putative peptidoglycan lipid II flippase
MFNVVTILCAFTIVPLMPAVGLDPIVGIAVGTLLGGAAQLALQWPTLRREGFRYEPLLDWRDPGLRRVLVLMGPGAVGMAATQVNVLVNTALATSQETGAVSWLNYAFRLMYLPIGLFGVSIATATLPAVSRLATAPSDTGGSDTALRNAAVRDTISGGLSLMLMLNVPATVGLITLAVPIVRVIFEHGRFTPADTAATAAALQFYAAGLVGYSVVRIASPTFYALGRNRVPVVVSILTVLVNAGLNLALVRTMGFRGLALGTSIAALLNATVLLVLLHRHLSGLNASRLLSALARITVASALMGTAAVGVDAALAAWWPSPALVAQIVRLAVTIAAALAVLAGAAWLLRIGEFNDGIALVARRFRRARR